jgi:hypothetical protein
MYTRTKTPIYYVVPFVVLIAVNAWFTVQRCIITVNIDNDTEYKQVFRQRAWKLPDEPLLR